MQILIQTGSSNKPRVYELSEDKVKFLLQFVDYLADEIVVENNSDFKKAQIEVVEEEEIPDWLAEDLLEQEKQLEAGTLKTYHWEDVSKELDEIIKSVNNKRLEKI